MKLTTFLLLASILSVSAGSFAQNVTVNMKNARLETVFNEFKKQTGYDFVYNEQLIDGSKSVSIKLKNVNLEDALKKALEDQPLTYVLENNVVTIKQKEPSFLDKIKSALGITEAQVTGKITDEKGVIMSGVTVSNKTSKKSTVSQPDGSYSIAADKGNVLVFSFIGYSNKEVIVGDLLTIDISLLPTISRLNDVVVVGYGTIQRKDLTGATATVEGKEIEDIPFTTFDNALAGKVAGVEVTKDDGSPGGAVRIRVRGSSSFLGGNDPLYVIDGVPVQATSNFQSPGYDVISPNTNLANGNNAVTNTSLATSFVNGLNSLGGLNPDDIESITVLKDASSTAIYGSKAANGVVVITTKRGKKNMKPQITATYYTTVNTPVLPHLLDASQFKSVYTQAAQNTVAGYIAAGTAVPSNVSLVLSSPTYFGTANTNWLDLVTRNTMSNNAEVSVQGGAGSSSYFNSISYTSTPGTMLSTGYQRISGKINMLNDIGTKFRFGTNLLLGYTNQDIGSDAYGQAMIARPDFAPYDANGNFTSFSGIDPFNPKRIQNPVALLNVENNSKTFSLLGSLFAIYDITPGLQFKSTVSTNVQMYNQRNYTPSYIASLSLTSSAAINNGIGSNETSTSTEWLVENTLSYNKTFDNKNTLNFLAGTSYESDELTSFGAVGTGYPNDNQLTSLSSAVTPTSVSGTTPTVPQSYLISFYLRANYSYQDKYILTFTGRADGSSKFGPDNKFGYFPSAGAAWRISEEKFLKGITWIDDIKLRGSYGLTGTQNIGDQMYRTLYSASSYNGSSVLIPTQLGNSAVKWESTLQADGGIDITLFNGRLTATVDYYNKQTNNDLLSLPIASNTSYSTLLTNVGGLKNTGWEFALQGDIIRTKDFKWNAGMNITFDKSIVTKLNPSVSLAQIGNLSGVELENTTLIQGQPLGLITGLTETGLIENQAELTAYKAALRTTAANRLQIGDPMFQLVPGGGAFNYNTIIGHGAPKYWGGFSQGFTYKNFDLQLNFTYSVGGQLLWADHVAGTQFYAPTNVNTLELNAYSPTNTNATLPELLIGSSYYKSTLDVFSSSFLKLRSLRLNYTLSKYKWTEKAGFKSVVLFGSATNVFTITKYPGNDPEISDDPYSLAGGYIDVSNYPTIRTYSFGIKASF